MKNRRFDNNIFHNHKETGVRELVEELCKLSSITVFDLKKKAERYGFRIYNIFRGGDFHRTPSRAKNEIWFEAASSYSVDHKAIGFGETPEEAVNQAFNYLKEQITV